MNSISDKSQGSVLYPTSGSVTSISSHETISPAPASTTIPERTSHLTRKGQILKNIAYGAGGVALIALTGIGPKTSTSPPSSTPKVERYVEGTEPGIIYDGKSPLAEIADTVNGTHLDPTSLAYAEDYMRRHDKTADGSPVSPDQNPVRGDIVEAPIVGTQVIPPTK